jgi:thiamine biosynthesis protein ThiS
MQRVVYNGEPRSLAEGTSVAGFLAELKLDPRRVAVEVNLELVPRKKHAETILADGDRVEIVTLVGGG